MCVCDVVGDRWGWGWGGGHMRVGLRRWLRPNSSSHGASSLHSGASAHRRLGAPALAPPLPSQIPTLATWPCAGRSCWCGARVHPGTSSSSPLAASTTPALAKASSKPRCSCSSSTRTSWPPSSWRMHRWAGSRRRVDRHKQVIGGECAGSGRQCAVMGQGFGQAVRRQRAGSRRHCVFACRLKAHPAQPTAHLSRALL